MKDNTGKCYLILTTWDSNYLILTTWDSNQIQIRNSLIQGSLCKKFHSIKFDHELTFDQHVKSLWKK